LPLPRDVGIEKDNFQKSKIFNETDSLINYILNILIMKPGNLPGLPDVGVDIGRFVDKNMNKGIDSDMIKGLILDNCMNLLPYLSSDEIYVGVLTNADGQQYLVIKLTIATDDGISKEYNDVYYAFYRSTLNELEFNFLVDRDA
jgi:hypothetical protein